MTDTSNAQNPNKLLILSDCAEKLDALHLDAPLHLDTKYYSATVQCEKHLNSAFDCDGADAAQALILIFSSHADFLSQAFDWMAVIDVLKPDVLLCYCTESEESASVSDSVREWCADNNAEIVYCAAAQQQNDIEYGEKRVLEALKANLWPERTMKVDATKQRRVPPATATTASDEDDKEFDEAKATADLMRFEDALEAIRKRAIVKASDSDSEQTRQARLQNADRMMALFLEGAGLTMDDI